MTTLSPAPRPRRLRPALFLVVAVVLAMVALPAGPAATDHALAATDERPNVVIIYSDDQTVDQLAVMERTRVLIADQGLTFTDSVVSYPLCCPSRASLLTGQYTQNNGVRSNTAGTNGNPLPSVTRTTSSRGRPAIEAWPAFQADAEQTSIAVALQQSGYHTGLLGKYLNGYAGPAAEAVPPGWTDWRGAVAESDSRTDYWDTRLNVNGTIVDHPGEYRTDRYATEAEDMIDLASTSGDPFFLLFSFTAPHRGVGDIFPPRHADRFTDDQAPRDPAFNADNDHHPPFLPRRYPELDPAAIDQIDERWRSELRALLALDEAVERIVDRLSARGELDDTLLVFTSDNGLFHGEHRVGFGKYLPYEPALRVPLLIRGPMIPDERRGTEVDEPVVNVDLAPTVLDYAETAPLRPPDGRSLRPLLETRAPVWNRPGSPTSSSTGRIRPVYIMGVGGGTRTTPQVTYSGVRSGDGFVYIAWEDPAASTELYDLDRDPHQLVNLADDPAYQGVRQRLERQRRLLIRCSGRSCDVPPYGYLDLPRTGVTPAWFTAASWADASGLGAAFADGTFRPAAAVTRGQLLGWLWRRSGAPVHSEPHGFIDVPASLDRAVRWAVANGIVSDAPPARFNGDAPVTRQHVVLWLYRAAGSPPVTPDTTLPVDIEPGTPLADAARWIIADPDGDGPGRPILSLTEGSPLRRATVARQTAITMLWRLHHPPGS